MSTPRLLTDASNRALRTFLQGLGFTILAAVVMVLLPAFTNAQGWGDFHWGLLAFAIVQACGTSFLSYLMRTVLDPSRVPTPLPPADPGEPDALKGERGQVGLLYILLVVVLVLLLLWLVGAIR
jgi:ABC-type amino acid transport system permease subunit